ncbi:acyl carrier protein [Abyssibius alkaniclasticus]|uniref:acyl carrier protein n=1 Tax=Abyssibius alkaniclasticus TaxID=2881234 RepID=UPI004059B45C
MTNADGSEAIQNTVLDYIANHFGIEANKLTRATVADDLAGWDSMANAEIILGLEDTFGIELEPEDLLKLDNVGCLIDVFNRKMSE